MNDVCMNVTVKCMGEVNEVDHSEKKAWHSNGSAQPISRICCVAMLASKMLHNYNIGLFHEQLLTLVVKQNQR